MGAIGGSRGRTPVPVKGLSFGILGPLQVSGHDGDLAVPPGRQQVVLGALALEANRIVSVDYLVDAIWGEEPPGTARTQVQICVSRLRKSLVSESGVSPIETRSPGYRINLADDQFDFTVYGRIAGNQDVPAGSYSDTVVATVNF